jgi:hypothetical protein
MSRERAWLVVDVLLKFALLGLVAHALAFPDLPQYAGKAMLGRVITYPLVVLAVPALWWLFLRGRRSFPVAIDLLVTLPFVIDLGGNALNLYDSIVWWDDANHFFNWAGIAAAVSLALAWTKLPALARFGLAVGMGAVIAIAWEIAEYVTFIQNSPELTTAYTDTLGDLVLGTLGSALGALVVLGWQRLRSGASAA